MTELIVATREALDARIRKRAGETKLGECVQTLPGKKSWMDELHESSARFVLLGIPEDIGIRANYGRGGAWSAWEPALSTILNIQSTENLRGDQLLVLGQIHTQDLMKRCDALDFKTKEGVAEARALTSALDVRVIAVVRELVRAGKIPIIIGGGHNNAYANIRGTVEALRELNQATSLSVINCDAHSDFREVEGRHSGNGFRYAWEEGYLNKYAMIGLHENYLGQNLRDALHKHPQRVHYSMFDHLLLGGEAAWQQAIQHALEFTKGDVVGLELDLDAIENIPSSARTPSGISANQARQYILAAAQSSKVAYLHLCEAAPVLAHRNADFKTGKLMAYLVGDFLRMV